MATNKLRIVPLGGLGEIGKNMIALEYENDIIVIDAGLMFPNEETPGVDLLIPDISYLLQRQQNIRGIVITHGHEDHIGALPYVIPRLSVPIYATKLTKELILAELRQRGVKTKAHLQAVSPGTRIALGTFTVEFFSVCHSIPDSAGLIIKTPAGVIVHSGDFKLDHTPVIGTPTDFNRLASLGSKGIWLLLSDSTYAELPGYTPSETAVAEAMDHIMAGASGRVIVTTFSSLISRLQQVIDIAAKHGRRIAIIGRSMREIAIVALKTGYLTAPPGVLCRFDELENLPHNQVVLLTTGSQGEPTSALVRMANRDRHSQVQIVPGDTVVISATPIPGNEALVNKTIDSLFRQGAQVVYDKLAQVHVHGHGSQEELKLLLSLVKPRFFIPIHGEYRHLSLHATLAHNIGIRRDNIFVLENGDVLEVGQEKGRVVGKAPVGDVFVNGSVIGELDSDVLHDRRLLSRDGVVVVSLAIDAKRGKLLERPRITARGVIDAKESQTLLQRGQDAVIAALDHDKMSLPAAQSNLDARVKDSLARFLYEQTHRRPIIIPVITKV